MSGPKPVADMTREELEAEVERLRKGIVTAMTAMSEMTDGLLLMTDMTGPAVREILDAMIYLAEEIPRDVFVAGWMARDGIPARIAGDATLAAMSRFTEWDGRESLYRDAARIREVANQAIASIESTGHLARIASNSWKQGGLK